MYRPQKKQTSAGKDPRNPKHSPLGGDDRNLVEVDDAFRDADIEDRMWLFWQKYHKTVVAFIVIALFVVLGAVGFRVYEDVAAARMQEAYAAAETEDELRAFAGHYADRPLGGFALLEVADQAYEDGDYSEAIGLYRQAVGSLGGTPFADRARLGSGIAAIKAGQTEEGERILRELGLDPRALQAMRAEASYYLALRAVERDDFSDASLWLDRIDELEYAGIWQQQALSLRMSQPDGFGG